MARHGRRPKIHVRKVPIGEVEPMPTWMKREYWYNTTKPRRGVWADKPVDRGDRCYKLNGIQLCVSTKRGLTYWNVLYCPPRLQNLPRGRVCELTSNGTIQGDRAYIDIFFAEKRRRHMGERIDWARGKGLGGYTFGKLMAWFKRRGVKYVSLSPMDRLAREFWEHMGFSDIRGPRSTRRDTEGYTDYDTYYDTEDYETYYDVPSGLDGELWRPV